MNPMKLENWGGANKARVRLFKKHDAQKLVRTLPEGHKLKMLSFAGSQAIFERLLVNHKLIKSEDITTIQTYQKMSEGHFGAPILKNLIRVRNRHLSKMKIWPHNFESFSQCYTSEGCSMPGSSSRAKWAKPPYRKFMRQVTDAPVTKFNMLDIDLCGIFSKKNADCVEALFKNGILDPHGLLFITHQKGRDVRGGKLFDVLYGYLKNNSYFDFDSIPEIDNEEYKTYNARYILIPLYYMCKARDHGYILELSRLIEYKDLGTSSKAAVNMLQYFFKWAEVDSVKDADSLLRDQLELVMGDDYQYHTFVTE